MNVLLCIHPFGVGGAERQVIELAVGLNKRGHNVRICSLSKPGPLAQEAIDRGITADFIQKKSKYDLTIIPKIKKYIKNNKTDVLQCFLFGADVWGSMAGRLANVKVLLISDRAGGHANNPKEYQLIKCFNKIAWRYVDGIVSNTKAGKDTLCSKMGVPENKVFVVPNGISCDRYKGLAKRSTTRAKIGLRLDSFVVAITGTIKPVKNHEMFMRMAKAVCAENKNIEFVVIGDGVNMPKMMELANTYRVSKKVIFLKQRQDVPELLAACDLGVLTSHWEGFPNAIMEYMAVGLPVVATRVGGATDLIIDGVTGYLTRPDDEIDMVQCINKIFENPSLARKMGQAGKKRIFLEFNHAKLAAKMVHIYTSILKRKT